MNLYFDNCCYNRLFDDRSNIKNYLEREAILIIMQKAFEGEYDIIGSEVLEIEMGNISNEEKRDHVLSVYDFLKDKEIAIDSDIEDRAREIMAVSKIRAFDSLHLATAEISADVLLTTDIKFLRNANRIPAKIKVKNPIEFVMEVIDYDTDN